MQDQVNSLGRCHWSLEKDGNELHGKEDKLVTGVVVSKKTNEGQERKATYQHKRKGMRQKNDKMMGAQMPASMEKD
jgi:hypothetical protein